MIAKYPGTCRYCKKPIEAGKDEYCIETKTSYHHACRENHPPGPEGFRLADELGFVPSSDIERASWIRICADWVLRHVRQADRRSTAGRPESDSHPRSNATLF